MSEKEMELFDVDAQLDEFFGPEGSESRKAAEQRADAFFTEQIIDSSFGIWNLIQI
jgi:hypothetical protein